MAEPWYRDKVALEAAVVLYGSTRAASRATGVPRGTLQKWLDPDSWRVKNRRYKVTERARAKKRIDDARRRARVRELGLCGSCSFREPSFGMTRCDRCDRYDAERKWLGYSTIPLAKGSEG